MMRCVSERVWVRGWVPACVTRDQAWALIHRLPLPVTASAPQALLCQDERAVA